MDGSIQITATAQERTMLLQAYRSAIDLSTSQGAHIVLLRADGLTWQQMKAVLFCSFDLISTTLALFREGRVAAVLKQQTPQRSAPTWMMMVLHWVSQFTPRDFGNFRTRWSCEILTHLLAFETGLRLSGDTIGRGLQRLGFAWRRPRLVMRDVGWVMTQL